MEPTEPPTPLPTVILQNGQIVLDELGAVAYGLAVAAAHRDLALAACRLGVVRAQEPPVAPAEQRGGPPWAPRSSWSDLGHSAEFCRVLTM